jgi:hypothetical protein
LKAEILFFETTNKERCATLKSISNAELLRSRKESELRPAETGQAPSLQERITAQERITTTLNFRR